MLPLDPAPSVPRAGPAPHRFHTARLIRAVLEMKTREQLQFRTSMVADFSSSLMRNIIQVLFWWVLLHGDARLVTWSFGEVMLFLAFTELFTAVQRGLLYGVSQFHNVIHAGQLDVYLTTPLDPRLHALLAFSQPLFFVRSLPSVVMYLAFAVASGATLHPSLLVALLLMLCGTWIYTELQLLIGFTGFWLGQVEGITYLMNSVWEALRYPTSIFSGSVYLILTYLLPIGYAATLPARATLHTDWVGPLLALGTSLTVAFLWHVLQDVTWKRGMRRYEGTGYDR